MESSYVKGDEFDFPEIAPIHVLPDFLENLRTIPISSPIVFQIETL